MVQLIDSSERADTLLSKRTGVGFEPVISWLRTRSTNHYTIAAHNYTYICTLAISFFRCAMPLVAGFCCSLYKMPIIICLSKQMKNSQGISSTSVCVVLGHVFVSPSQDSLLTLIGFATYLNVLFTGPHVADQALHCKVHSTVSHSPER